MLSVGSQLAPAPAGFLLPLPTITMKMQVLVASEASNFVGGHASRPS